MANYLHVESVYPSVDEQLPPILLIHGAANAAWVWRFWLVALAGLGWPVHAVDLRGHGGSSAVDLARTSMLDYVEDVECAASWITADAAAPVVFGWSMGGLIAQQFAARHGETPALVLLSPSPPAAVQGAGSEASDAEITEIPDTFGAEYYGLGEPRLAARVLDDLTQEEQAYILDRPGQDSGLARRERKRGIAVDAADVRCPAMLIYGERDRYFPPELSRAIAAYYGADVLPVPSARHWGAVASESIVSILAPSVDAWLRSHITSTAM